MSKKKSPVFFVIKTVLIIILILVLAVALLFGALVVTEYNPKDTEPMEISHGTGTKALSIGDEITVLTWNVGYCGLSKGADFFMDGGTSVRSQDKDSVKANLSAIEDQILALDPDVAFLQEVDVNCTRSFGIDEVGSIRDTHTDSDEVYAPNFKVLFIPYPIPPMGHMSAGIQTISKYFISDATRIQLPCPFSGIERLGNLKRCLLVSRVPVEGSDKEFVFVNLHLEAYDSGEGKIAQTKQLADFIQSEYEKGNYVVAGGDFNQSFSNVDTSMYPRQSEDLWMCGKLDTEAFADNWQFVMDNSTPSCRSLDRAYDKDDDTFQFYMIDGFIVSDNLKLDSIETHDFGFENSDHNPVTLQVTLE